MEKILVLAFIFALIFPLVNAGVGIKWNKESSLVTENTKVCMTYNVYNPWPEDTYAEISLSPELMDIVDYIGSDVVFVPKETPSSEALPIEFCFKTPRVYSKDCWIGNVFFCKQDCSEGMKTYEGDVIVQEASTPSEAQSAQGSATTMEVSAPLRIKVHCIEKGRNFTALYALIAIIAAILLMINLFKKRKGKSEKKGKSSNKKK